MPNGHWRATNGAANGAAHTNGSAHPSGNCNGKMTLDKHEPEIIDRSDVSVSEKVSRPKVVDPEWGELTLEKAREKLVSHDMRRSLVPSLVRLCAAQQLTTRSSEVC